MVNGRTAHLPPKAETGNQGRRSGDQGGSLEASSGDAPSWPQWTIYVRTVVTVTSALIRLRLKSETSDAGPKMGKVSGVIEIKGIRMTFPPAAHPKDK